MGQPQFDVVVAGDMTRWGERSFRIAQEVRSYAASGRRVGLLHASALNPDSRIAPEIQTCVRRGLATVVEPSTRLMADLLVVHAPSELEWSRKPLSGIRADDAMLICHQVADYSAPRISQRVKAGTVQWAPINRSLREAAPRTAKLTTNDWRPMLTAVPARHATRKTLAK